MTSLLPRLFLDQVRRTPNAPAVIGELSMISYAELEQDSRAVAGALAARGIGAESTVGVLVAPGPDLARTLLGIWLAGACYLPLDPLAPAQRIARTLALADAALVVADDLWPDGEPALLGTVPRCRPADLARFAGPAPVEDTHPRQSAYMIFTSGSTGTPKAVVIEHEGIANTVRWHVDTLRLTSADRVLQKTPLAFDAAQWEVFAPLVCGAAVAFGDNAAGRDSRALLRSITARRATVVQVVPTMLRLLDAEADLAQCTSLRMICSGGEQLRAELCQSVLRRLDVEIWNTYGPTECAIDLTAARFDPAQQTGPVPIGRPLDNAGYLLLPPDGPEDDPAIRELYARGPGVGRGYHGDPARTAERFLPDPAGPPGSRMYRTGDLMRERADGLLEFIGRVDGQTKINGVRIEPAEVEVALTDHTAVTEAAVRVAEDQNGNRKLAAWVVSDGATTAELIAHLRGILPPTMVPAVVTPVGVLPRTTSGKTDYRSLPGPDWTAGDDQVGSTTRYNPEQCIVQDAWRELLGIEKIGLDDDFFRLGGHSLMVAQLSTLLAESSGMTLEFRELHYATSVRAQAELLSSAAEARPVARLPEGARLPLSHGQERFWVLDRMNPGSSEYLLPLFVRLPSDLDPAAVDRAVARLASRHPALRTRYVMDAEGLTALVEPMWAPLLQVVNPASPEETADLVAGELTRGFDLTAAPPVRATLIRDAGPDQLLLLVLHHIVCDGWSARVLERDLTELLAADWAGRAPDLPALRLAPTDAVAWQRTELTDQVRAEELRYWRTALVGVPDLPLPRGHQPGQPGGVTGAAVDFELPADAVSTLMEIGRRTGASPFVVLLTLWTVTLARTGGQWDFGVGTPHARRSRPEFHDLVGLFINTVVIRPMLSPELSFAESLTRVAQACREGFARSAVPFEEVVEAVAAPRDASRTPLFQTIFTLGDDAVGQDLGDQELALLGRAWSTARTDLTLHLWPTHGGRYRGLLEYTSRIGADAATALTRRLCAAAEEFAADPRHPSGENEPEK